jgi:hypothetical protein
VREREAEEGRNSSVQARTENGEGLVKASHTPK